MLTVPFLDLAAEPTAVVVPCGLVKCIADIERALGGALALVSGRTLRISISYFRRCACERAVFKALKFTSIR